MKIASTIGVIMLVLGFLTSTLGAFPLADVSASGPEVTEETPFSKAIVETTAGQIGRIYTTLIADLVTFAYNPDLALAQSRVDQMTTFAEGLADQFQLLADDLQLRLDETTAAPAAPANVTAIGGAGQVTLDWDDNVETDIDFYRVYRATTQGGPYLLVRRGHQVGGRRQRRHQRHDLLLRRDGGRHLERRVRRLQRGTGHPTALGARPRLLMTEEYVALMMDRLLGERDPHLWDEAVRTMIEGVLVRRPPRAVVMNLNVLRSRAWGTCRQFTTVGCIEVFS